MKMKVKKICIVGAGTMGSGIAQVCAQSGFGTSLVDLNEELVKKGVEHIRVGLEKLVKKGKLTDERMHKILNTIHGTADLKVGVSDADLVIEAVFEDLNVKTTLFKQLDEICPPNVIFATNTSSLSVTQMAKYTNRESNFVGMHFFYPAQINQLIEIIPAENTDPAVVNCATTISRSLDKIPVHVKDSPGFAVNRFFVPFLNESCKILEEGIANIPTIDSAAKQCFSINMGPFELMNATGIPIAYHSINSLYQTLGEFYKPSKILQTQFEKGEKWDLGGEVDETKYDIISRRLLGVVFSVVCRLVEEGVARKEDIEKGAMIGLAWKEGPFALMNKFGISKSIEMVKGVTEVPKILERQLNIGDWYLSNVRLVKEGHIATVFIDRPTSLNALNTKVLCDLDNVLDELQKDENIRCVIITGEGRAFVAGADIKEMINKSPLDAMEYTQLGQRVFKKIEELDKVVIAAVNGFALGGGCELALACDILIASENAKLGLPEVGLGIHPGFGGTQRLPRLIGKARAKELIFTGDMIDATYAERIGLVNHVVPHLELMEESRKIAEKIASKAPIGVKLAKYSINRGVESDLATGLAYEIGSISLAFSTEDKLEGMKAFLEKRKPEFKGK